MAAKKKTQRIPRYKDADGQYLDIDESRYEIKIAWYLPDEGDFGLYLANESHSKWEGAEETNVAIDVLRDYWKSKGWALPSEGRDFEFESRSQAKEALRLINARLFYLGENKPLPEWAKKALAEGWNPPKGWKP
jgi:hypothetical protein